MGNGTSIAELTLRVGLLDSLPHSGGVPDLMLPGFGNDQSHL